MMSARSPWDSINIPSNDFNVRLARESAGTQCYWGRDHEGSYLFILELKGNHTAQFRKNYTSAKGLDVDLRDGGANVQRLVLKLGEMLDGDLFAGLCRTLMASLSSVSDDSSALAIALAHIQRWKNFLATSRSQLLTAEEIRGLFAELVFLGELINHERDSMYALTAWLGPERSHQDFVFNNRAVEVKSLSGSERSSIRISSEDQLETQNDKIYLCIYRLSSALDSPSARSLNAEVELIRSMFSDNDAIEKFERKLATFGYAPRLEYELAKFIISDKITYQVDGLFPRLIRSCLPESIMKVSYEIKMESIESFVCEPTSIWGDA